MYILSKHENYLWLDADVYCYSPELVFKSFDFNSKFISKTWSKLYNANDLAYFKNIYQAYIDYLYPQKCDRRMMEALNLDMSWNKILGLTHLFYLENYPNANWIQISNIADVPYTEDRISWRQKTVYFYKGECLVSDGAFALYNDKNLINFINTNYSDKIKII